MLIPIVVFVLLQLVGGGTDAKNINTYKTPTLSTTLNVLTDSEEALENVKNIGVQHDTDTTYLVTDAPGIEFTTERAPTSLPSVKPTQFRNDQIQGRCFLRDLKKKAGVSSETEIFTNSGENIRVQCEDGYTPRERTPKCLNGRWTYNSSSLCRKNLVNKNSEEKPNISSTHRIPTNKEEVSENKIEIGTQPDDGNSVIPTTEVPENESFTVIARRDSTSEHTPLGNLGNQRQENVTCDRPPPVEGGIAPRIRERQPIGTVVAYHCDYGYVSQGPGRFLSKCEFDEETDTAQWSKPEIVCFPRSCGDPGFVMDARRIGSVFTFPNTVEFECEEGYKLVGAGVRYCQASGVWSGKLPTCKQISCDPPRSPANGRVRYTSLNYGTELFYECNKGYALSDNQPRYCSESGTWSNDEPACIEISCKQPEAPKNGYIQSLENVGVGGLVFYSCEEGKALVGAPTSKCLENGEWTFPPPECVDQCEVPHVENGKIGQYRKIANRYRETMTFVPLQEGNKVNPSESVILSCNNNFVPEENPTASQQEAFCEDGTWSASLKCKSVSCDGDPPSLENGFPVVNNRHHGHIIYYKCNEHYEKTKDGRVECFYGTWKGFTPICSDVRCYTNQLNFPGLQKPGAEFLADKDYFTITCEKGYKVIGRKEKIYCKKGKWEINYNPCTEARCYIMQLNFPGLLKPDEEFLVDDDYFPISCREGYEVVSQKNKIYCKDGRWDTDNNPCTKVSCSPEPPPMDNGKAKGINYDNGGVVFYDCMPGYTKVKSGNITCVRGEWKGVPPVCECSKAYACFNSTTTIFPPFDSTTLTPRITSFSSTEAAEKRPGSTTPGLLIIDPLSSQKQDVCSCTYNYLNVNVMAFANGKELLFRSKVKKGDTVTIRCRNENNSLLKWNNGLRVSGSVNLTCDACETWNNLDLPNCVLRYSTDASVVFNSQMKLLRGGVVQIPEAANVHIQCLVSHHLFSRVQFPYPEWKSSSHKEISYVSADRGSIRELITYLHINNFRTELAGRYECYGRDYSGNQYSSTVLNLKLGRPEVHCPALENKGIFHIIYNHNRKVNSIAMYSCLSEKQTLNGERIRTCLENGEWSGEEPSCVDITCPIIRASRSLDVTYTKANLVGSKALFSCKEKGVLTGSPFAICLVNGTWSNSRPYCKEPEISCPEIDDKDTFIIRYDDNNRKVNSKAIYACRHSEDKLLGDNVLRCQENGEWRGVEPVCEPQIICPEIDGKGIFIVQYDNHRIINSNAQYSCRNSEDKMQGENVRRCQENGEWSGVDPECVAPGCSIHDLMRDLTPGIIPNEEDITGELLLPGSELRLLCEDNKVLVGHKKAVCNRQGRWNLGIIQCKFGCHLNAENSSPYLVIEPRKDFYGLGEGVTFSCKENYILTTEVVRLMCMGSEWSDEIPECKALDANVQN